MRCAASLMHAWSVLQKLREWRARKAPLGAKRTAEENAHWAAGLQAMSESQSKATLPTEEDEEECEEGEEVLAVAQVGGQIF